MITNKSKGQQSSATVHYPSIFAKAKKSFTETVQGKLSIKEKVLYLDRNGKDKEVQDIIKSLGQIEFYNKPDEGILQLVKKFYVNLEGRVDDKVFLRGKWINMLSEKINKLIGAPDHEEDEYFVLMDEEVETTELVKQLCQEEKEVIWAIGKNNQFQCRGTAAMLDTTLQAHLQQINSYNTHIPHYIGKSYPIVCNNWEKEDGCQMDNLQQHN